MSSFIDEKTVTAFNTITHVGYWSDPPRNRPYSAVKVNMSPFLLRSLKSSDLRGPPASVLAAFKLVPAWSELVWELPCLSEVSPEGGGG
jgi:hypothetical protein